MKLPPSASSNSKSAIRTMAHRAFIRVCNELSVQHMMLRLYVSGSLAMPRNSPFNYSMSKKHCLTVAGDSSLDFVLVVKW
jgi:hypothetical protein